MTAYATRHGHSPVPRHRDAYAPARAARGARLVKGPRASIGAQKCVLFAIASYADPDGSSACPSMATLAFDTGYDERTVRAAVRSLEQQGALVVELGGNALGFTNRYRIVLPRLQAVPAPAVVDVETGEVLGASHPQGGGDTPPNPTHHQKEPPYPPESPAAPDDLLPSNAPTPRGRPPRRQPGCARHPARSRPGCRDCRPTPQPPRYVPPPGVPADPRTIAERAAAARAALAAARQAPKPEKAQRRRGAGGRGGGDRGSRDGPDGSHAG